MEAKTQQKIPAQFLKIIEDINCQATHLYPVKVSFTTKVHTNKDTPEFPTGDSLA